MKCELSFDISFMASIHNNDWSRGGQERGVLVLTKRPGKKSKTCISWESCDAISKAIIFVRLRKCRPCCNRIFIDLASVSICS